VIEFSLPELIDVNINVPAPNAAPIYMVNGSAVSREDFTAIMAAVQVMMLAQVVPEEDEEVMDPDDPPFGGAA
jgi:hypothetical protein